MRLYGAVNITGGVTSSRGVGSFNISVEQDNSNQLAAVFNTGVNIDTVGDVVGGSVLCGVVSSVLINIDIIPEEIKQALENSGVKFL